MKTLVVITGPTGVGKTRVAIEVAQQLGCEIVNADSRQIFRGIPIGTAAPTAEEQALVKHHFVAFKNLDEYYSAAQYEADVMQLLPAEFWPKGDYAVLCGGSMMYVDAVCKGIDIMPDISDSIRHATKAELADKGLDHLLAELQRLDPAYYEIVDRKNPVRVVHAVEICRQTGTTYTSLRTGNVKERPFRIMQFGLNMNRADLFDRINRRVDAMIDEGFVDEARSVYPMRHFNSLNTVGFKEMFAYFDGTMDFVTARERMKKNTRVYAKKQLTWYAKNSNITWLHPSEAVGEIRRLVDK